MKALVTGGSRGIGAAIVARLRADGVEVVAPTTNELNLEDSSAIYLWCTNEKKQGSPFNAIVNCAGINIAERLPGTGGYQSDDWPSNWWPQIEPVNTNAPMMLIEHLAPLMPNGSRIVNVSSILATRAKPGRCAYSMSKAALEALTRSIAIEYGPKGILCNAVAPGYVETDMTTRNNTPEQLNEIRQRIPLQRLAKPEEVAELVAFLVSPRNTYINGQVITIDGGLTCAI